MKMNDLLSIRLHDSSETRRVGSFALPLRNCAFGSLCHSNFVEISKLLSKFFLFFWDFFRHLPNKLVFQKIFYIVLASILERTCCYGGFGSQNVQ